MKSLTETIGGGLRTTFSIAEADSNNNAAYTAIDVVDPKRSYKYGFLSYSQYDNSIFLVAFDSVEDIQDLLDTDDDDYSRLLNMKPQECKTIRGELFVKLW